MRLLHTADWHLGRVFYGASLIEDQAAILDQIVDAIAQSQPDAVLLAGDLYDRAVPPPEAVALLDDVLSRIVLGARIPVFAIAGNHDSPDRTEFLGRLLREGNLHLQGRLRPDAAPAMLMDEHGPVAIHLVPFTEPSVVDEFMREEARAAGQEEEDAGIGKLRRHHGDALRAMLARARAQNPKGARAVVVAHGSVVGGAESESERSLMGGASAYVAAGDFDGFAYAALGHFHRPQDVGSERVRYAGSPLQYSFSEEGHHKSLTLIDIDGAGNLTREILPLTPRRLLRTLEGTLAELEAEPQSNDFVRAILTDEVPHLDAAGRLRRRLPNLVHLEHARLQPALDRVAGAPARRTLDDSALFQAFFSEVMGEAPTDAESAALSRVLSRAQSKEREGGDP